VAPIEHAEIRTIALAILMLAAIAAAASSRFSSRTASPR
jgi:hypothetical protein